MIKVRTRTMRYIALRSRRRHAKSFRKPKRATYYTTWRDLSSFIWLWPQRRTQ